MTATQKLPGSKLNPPPRSTSMPTAGRASASRVEPWWTTVLDHLVQNNLQIDTRSAPIDPAIIDLVAFYRTQCEANLIPMRSQSDPNTNPLQTQFTDRHVAIPSPRADPCGPQL